MTVKQILIRSQAREKILLGATQLVDTVRVTLNGGFRPFFDIACEFK